jgi:hypothetical protein
MGLQVTVLLITVTSHDTGRYKKNIIFICEDTVAYFRKSNVHTVLCSLEGGTHVSKETRIRKLHVTRL